MSRSATLRAESSGGPFGPLRIAAFRLLWINALVFIFSVTSQAAARSWLALELEGTNAALGAVQLVFGLSMLAGIPLGGATADRMSKRAVVALSVHLVAVTSLLVGLAAVAGLLQFWMLIAGSAAQGLAFAFYSPARIALIADLVGPDDVGRAVVLSQVGYSLMLAIGPALAGVLVAVPGVGAEGVFLASGVLCLIVGALTLRLPRTSPVARAAGDRGIGAGGTLGYVRSTPGLGLLTAIAFVVILAGFPYVTFLPSLAEAFGGGSALFGVMSAVVSSGALVFGLGLAAASGTSTALMRSFVVSGVVLGVGLVALGFVPVLAVTLPLLFVAGGAVLAFQTANQALVMKIADRRYHGRLQGVLLLGFTGASLVAMPLGLLADAVGLGPMLGSTGAVVVVAMLAFLAAARRGGLGDRLSATRDPVAPAGRRE